MVRFNREHPLSTKKIGEFLAARIDSERFLFHLGVPMLPVNHRTLRTEDWPPVLTVFTEQDSS